MIFHYSNLSHYGQVLFFLTFLLTYLCPQYIFKSMVLIYDGECTLCQATKDWIEKHAVPGQIEFLPCQSEERKRRFPQIKEEVCLQAMQVISPDGQIFAGDKALPEILSRLRRWRWFVYIFRLPGIKFLSPHIYALVSKNRHRFMSKVKR